MGTLSSIWILTFKLTCILFTFTGVSGAVSQCEAFPGCSCSTISNDRGVELGTLADCSSKSLTNVPTPNTSFNKPIYELKLNNNSIVSLGENILPNINITKLDLSNNAISSVHNNTFRNLGNYLKILILSGNSTSEPPKDAFYSLVQLEQVILKNYNVPHVSGQKEYFLPFPKLKYLTLDNWKLESLDQRALQTHGSILLNLSLLNQPMSILPLNELREDYLQNLRKLQISGTHINTISHSAFELLNSIQELDLSYNQIHTIEENCFNGIEDTLVKLSLVKNIFTGDASNLLGLKNLANMEELDLSDNSITHIPDLSQLLTMKPLKLYLRNTGITSLPASAFVSVADKLHTLDLSNNEIISIDANAFTSVTKLEILFLSHQGGLNRQPLVLPQSLTGAAWTLKQLYVDGQEISPSVWSIIGQLTMLEILNLASTGLDSIPNKALEKLTHLKSLDLSGNRLNTITPAALVGPRNLNYLSLARNSFSTLSSCMFYQYTNYPITMTMGSNLLRCDCAVRWLLNRIKDNSIIFPPGQDAVCSDNQPLASKKIEDLCKMPYTEPPCQDYYADPKLTISLKQIDNTSFSVSWQLSDSSDVTNFTVRVTSSDSHQPVHETSVQATFTSHHVNNLINNMQYEICVIAFLKSSRSVSNCTRTQTIPNTTDKTDPQTGPSPENLGIIIGAVIGGVVLLAILGAIGYLLIVRRKSEEKVPNNVPVQPRNFSKSELPSMTEDTRTFAKPKRPRGSDPQEHREGMQVVAISDGQTGHGRVGRAHLINSDGSFKNSTGSKPSSISDQSSHEAYENDQRPLPPTPSRHSSTYFPPGYYNMGYKDDKYDEIGNGKESVL